MEQTPTTPEPVEKQNEELKPQIEDTLEANPSQAVAPELSGEDLQQAGEENLVDADDTNETEAEKVKAELVDNDNNKEDETENQVKAEPYVPSGRTFILHSSPEKEDYVDALKQINKINWITWATMGMFIIIMAVILFFNANSGQQTGNLNMLWSVGLILFAAYMLIHGLVINPKRLANKLISDPVLSVPGTTTIDEVGLLDSKSSTGKPVPWTAFKDIFETDRSFLLLAATQRGAYQLLSKRSFASPKEVEEFRKFAAGHLPAASLRKVPVQILPMIMFIISVGMLIYLLVTRLLVK